jgi:O-antigen/teichoic acid export membrane protein
MRTRDQILSMGTAQAISAGLAVIYSVLAARGLGPAMRGQFFLIQAFFTVASMLVSLSTSTIMTVQVSREQFNLAEVHTSAVLLSVVLGLAGGAVALLVYLKSFGASSSSLLVLALYFLSLPAMLYKNSWMAIFLGLGRIGELSIYTVADVFLTAAGAGIALYVFHAGLSGMLIMLVIETTTIAVAGVLLTFSVNKTTWQFSRACITDLLRQGWKQHLATTATQLYLRADAFILAPFLTPAALGQYAVARGLSERVLLAFTPFAQVMFPHISSRDEMRAKSCTQTTFRQLAGLGIILAAILLVVMPWFILLLYGQAYRGAIILAQILCMAFIVRAITVPIELWFVGSLLKPGYNAVTSAFMLGSISILGYIFARHALALGMAVATLVSFALTLALTIWIGNAKGLGLRRFVPHAGDLRYVLSEVSQLCLRAF